MIRQQLMRLWIHVAIAVFTAEAIAQEAKVPQATCLKDVPAALVAVPSVARPLRFSLGTLELPTGGHLQGVQSRYDAAGERMLVYLSHDSVAYGYVVIVEFAAMSASEVTGPGRAVHLQRLPSDGEQPPLRHAGGFQVVNDILAVGVEDNQDKMRSQIQFWNVSQATLPVQLNHLTVDRKSDQPKKVTAGGVALAPYQDRYLLAVANWDSRAIDFYQSSGADLSDKECHFDLCDRWNAADAEKNEWQPDRKFATYQAINLIADEDGELCLLGFDTVGLGGNIVDLYKLRMSVPVEQRLTKIARKRMQLSAGNQFRAGGGASVVGGALQILSTPRNLSTETVINVSQ